MNECLPPISVVIPLYQKKDYILRALESVSRQSHPAAEVIVVDDGSTDGGAEIVAAQNLRNVKLFRQQNSGAAAARNRGIELAENRYIAFLDADDTWEVDHLAEIAALISDNPRGVIFGTAWTEFGKPVIDPQLSGGASDIDLSLYLRRSADNFPPFWTSATTIDKAALDSARLFEIGSRIAEDQDAWITMLGKGFGVRSLKVTAHYNIDEQNPTIANPSPADFKSVIFQKWMAMAPALGEEFAEFVSVHQLYTVERHLAVAPSWHLMHRAWRIPTKRNRVRKLRLLLRLVARLPFLRSR